jgi:hypothetical protein
MDSGELQTVMLVSFQRNMLAASISETIYRSNQLFISETTIEGTYSVIPDVKREHEIFPVAYDVLSTRLLADR